MTEISDELIKDLLIKNNLLTNPELLTYEELEEILIKTFRLGDTESWYLALEEKYIENYGQTRTKK